MNYKADSTINETKLNHIATWIAGNASISTGTPLGIIVSFRPEVPAQAEIPAHSTLAASCVLDVCGESRVVAGGEVVPGDFFASNADGRAVATSTGLALGRILEPGSAGDLVACVITPTEL